MGTTRIKVIDLSSDQKEIKTSRKHAEKLAGAAKIKKAEKQSEKPAIAEITEIAAETTDKDSVSSVVAATPKSTEEDSVPSVDADSVSSVGAKRQSLHHKGKKYQAAKKLIEDKTYSAKEALAILPKASITKFDATVEIHANVVDKNLRVKVSLPHPPKGGKQKEKKYLVFNDKQLTINDKPTLPVGRQVIWGDEKTIEQIAEGKFKPGRDFDIVIASPKFMPVLAKVAKILGPKGLMPNPKNGTIVDDPQKYFSQADSDISQIRTDPTAAIIHAKIGKLSQGEKELEENLKALILAIGPAKIQKAILKSTMSPAIKLDLAAI